MNRQLHSTSLLTFLVLMLLNLSAEASAVTEEKFNITAAPVTGELKMVGPMVSMDSGGISAVCSRTGTLHKGKTVVQYTIQDGAIAPLLNFPLPDPDAKPLTLVDVSRVLVMKREPNADYFEDRRNGVTYQLVDTATGEEVCITPGNLLQTTPWPSCGIPPVLWSDEYGLTMLVYEPETRQVVVWQGKEILEEVQRTPPVIACGGGFIDGRYTRVEVTKDGSALALNWDTGRLEEAADLDSLANEIAQLDELPQDKPLRFDLAQDIVVFKNVQEDTLYTVISSDGSRREIARAADEESDDEEIPALLREYSKEELQQQWNELTDAEKEAIVSEALLGFKRDRGLELPPDIVDLRSYITPVDDLHVGIVDITYQRLISIGLADTEQDISQCPR